MASDCIGSIPGHYLDYLDERLVSEYQHLLGCRSIAGLVILRRRDLTPHRIVHSNVRLAVVRGYHADVDCGTLTVELSFATLPSASLLEGALTANKHDTLGHSFRDTLLLDNVCTIKGARRALFALSDPDSMDEFVRRTMRLATRWLDFQISSNQIPGQY